MANIDVSELMLDPDFVDAFSIVRRSTTVNQYGENVLADTSTIQTFGSIQPTPARELQRLPESLRMRDVRTFWCKVEFYPDSSGNYPDILLYGTTRYQIISIEPWMNFGQGWNKGLCVRELST